MPSLVFGPAYRPSTRSSAFCARWRTARRSRDRRAPASRGLRSSNPSAIDFQDLEVDYLGEQIKRVGLWRGKAKNIHETMTRIAHDREPSDAGTTT